MFLQEHPLQGAPASKQPVSKVTVCRSARDLIKIEPLWRFLCSGSEATVFQNFDLNLLAAQAFSGREEPFVVAAEASFGAAIVPAVQRQSHNSLHLLGEELFDYRKVLHAGDDEVLREAVSVLATLQKPLEVVALRQSDCCDTCSELHLEPFCAAPMLRSSDMTADELSQVHTRLGRNLRRLQRLGYELKSYDGDNPQLLRAIYLGKAVQDPNSLFHDPDRIQFLVNAALLQPEIFEIFTLECGSQIGAALVTLLDGQTRRFYTGWFSPEIGKHSPALTLIYEVSRNTLEAGWDCDYMTGEQPYKLRLATTSIPLFKLKATPEQLRDYAHAAAAELKPVG